MKQVYPPKENTIAYPQFKIFLPYTDVLPATLICLIGYNYMPVKLNNKFDYSNYFKQRWEQKEKFISIEHDMLIWPGAIEAIWNCEEPLCTYNLSLPNHRLNKLTDTHSVLPGCIKITPTAIESSPNLWDNPIEWNKVDIRLSEIDTTIHEHFPGIVNANPALLGFVNYEDL